MFGIELGRMIVSARLLVFQKIKLEPPSFELGYEIFKVLGEFLGIDMGSRFLQPSRRVAAIVNLAVVVDHEL